MTKALLAEIGSIADIVRVHANRDAAKAAIEFEGRSILYGELHSRSNRVANGLLSAGVEPQQTVAFLDKNTPEYFEIVFGASKINAINVGVNWRLAPSEMQYILRDAGAQVLFVGPEFVSHVEAIENELPDLKTIIAFGSHDRWQEYEQWVDQQPASDPMRPAADDDVAFITYTSGTTGLPKGAMMSQAGFFAAFKALDSWCLDEKSVSLAMMPMFHFSGSGWSLLNLGIGSRIVLQRDVDLADIVDAIKRFKITNIILPPILIQGIMAFPGVEPGDLGSLRAISYGGSPISEAVLEDATRMLGCDLIQLYGLTETAGGVSQLDFEDHDPANRPELMRSCGKPFPWVELRIVDVQTGEDIKTGERGEIWVRAPQNMIGYWNKPEETAETITNDNWLRTGDIGRLDDNGYLYLLDRVSDMIVSGAENVYPVEVENALVKHPAVAEAAVIGVPDDHWGETVRAIVVRTPGVAATSEEIIEDTRAHLAGYKLPKAIDFVEELPRNTTGKVLRRELREPYWASREREIG